MYRKIVLGLSLLACLLLFGSVYPDGPFSYQIVESGLRIRASASDGISFSTYTSVVENYAGGVYTKTRGTTTFSGFNLVTDAPNTDLDNWYNSNPGERRDMLVEIRNGAGTVIESWRFYEEKIAGREALPDGRIKYYFNIPQMSERDTAVVMTGG